MTVPAPTRASPGDIMESVMIKGDLSRLTPEERSTYYLKVCESLKLNPLTRPFEYITLNGKLQLYAKRDAADQLRKINGISIKLVSQEVANDVLTVHAQATDKDGRADEDLGSVPFPESIRGEHRANAILKCVTKAKRRVTLSICGLGFLDETEVDDIPRDRAPRAAPNVMLDPPDPPSPPPAVSGGAAPDDAQSNLPQSSGAVGPANDNRAADNDNSTTRLRALDAALAVAAERGTGALQAEWDKIARVDREALVAALDRRHKPRAAQVDKRGVPR